MYRLFLLSIFLCAYGLLTFCTAQEADTEPANSLYESVIFPNRSLLRRLEQADRLFESGRTSEAAQLLGSILESANYDFIMPDESTDEENKPIRTLHQTINDYIIDRLRKFPKEARDSYAFQFESTAKRLLENAVADGSLDDVQQVARKYFPTPSGASAVLLVGLTQFERGDYTAAFLTLDRLKRQHMSIPEALKPILDKTLGEAWRKLHAVAEQVPLPLPLSISESAWLEQIGWRIPPGSPAQNSGTQASAPLLEQNWTVPIFNRLTLERETEALFRQVRNGDDVYLPASQPLVVGDLFVTRMLGETIAVDVHSGKRLWNAAELEYRFPKDVGVLPRPIYVAYHPRTTLRLFFWHDRISQQLSSDGERIFSIDEHDIQGNYQVSAALGRGIPNLPGGGEDRRYDPGNTLTARDLKTGRMLWQVGKFPYVQKYLDAFYASRPRSAQARPGNIDENLFTDDENALKDTWFLGAPLPLHGRLYVIGETAGVLQLFVFESQTGRLLARQPFAQSTASLEVDIVRRTYPLFPSASEGIVICPTGSGLIAALDATTLAPVWCYSYAPIPGQTSDQRNRNPNMPRMQQRMLLGPGANIEYTIKQIFSNSGWQIPSIIIDGPRVLAAPPDQGALYCLELQSGKLLWEQTVPRSNSLYVAGIHNGNVFLVTPVNVMMLDLNTGKDLTTSESQFPAALKPAGIGVRGGVQYFIPFTDGHLAVADLNTGKLTWLDTSGIAVVSPTTQVAVADGIDLLQRNSEVDSIYSPDLTANDVFQKPLQFGNLVGIKGRFFSQSPTQISCFDQKEPLKRHAETLLRADANDPHGLLQWGRILKSEGKLTEAIDAFRSSLKAKPTVEAASFLRQNLLEALRNDYPSWSHASQELESLAESPDEWGTILYAQIEGILQSGLTDDLRAVLEKVFAFGQCSSVLIPVSADHSVQLHRALGFLIEQSVTKGSPGLKSRWEELAERFFNQFIRYSDPTDSAEQRPSSTWGTDQSFQWLRDPVYQPPGILRWSMFLNIFHHTAARERAKLFLQEEYVQNHLSLALDLQEKFPAVSWSELPALFDWKRTGAMDMVVLSDSASAAANTLPNLPPMQSVETTEIDRLVSNLVRITRNPSILQNLSPIPFLGPSDSELAAFHYVLKPGTANELLFCCSELSGQELWRLPLPHTILSEYRDNQSNRYIGELSTYIKGFQHFLLFVHGTPDCTIMIAIDTTPQSEKILWSRTVSSPLPSLRNSMRMDNTNQRPNLASFPRNSVFVSPHTVCLCEPNSVYGLDPLTGQTLWVRKVPHERCTILGDEDNLFLVFPEIQHVIALDPASGWELASGPLPPDGMYVYGTNVVFMQQRGNDFTLHICDLRDLHDKRRRALLVADAAEGKLTPPIPSETLHDGVRSTSMMQTFQNDRFLSIATWDTKSLQIYDLQMKKRLLPEGNKLLEFVDGTVRPQTTRCDVEFVGDHFLVLFTKNTAMQPPRNPIQNEEGKTVSRSYQQVPGVNGIAVDDGVMMLFDSEGNPCWEKPTKVEKVYRLLDVPDRLPLMVFVVGVADREGNENHLETRIMGVDKRTGKERFRHRINGTAPHYVPLQYFRVNVDSEAQEITFTSQNRNPPRVVKLGFAEKADADK